MVKYEVEMMIARTDKTWATELVELTESEYSQGASNVESVATLKLNEKYKDSNNIALISLYCLHD